MTTIRYFVPEDGDLESQPNVFLAPKARNPNMPPTFGQVRDAFPMPGQYHFRFKSALVPGTDREKTAMAVWMDVVEERQPVPTWKNGIVVKVSRISMEDDDDDDDDDHFGDAAPAHVQAPAPQAQAPVPRAPPSHGSTASTGSIDDLFGAAPAPAVAPAPPSGGSLLDFGAPQPAAPASHDDFFGMTAHPPPQQQQQQQQQPQATGVQPAPSSGGYHGNPNNMYAQQQQQQQMRMQQQQQQRPSVPAPQQFSSFSSNGQQGQQGAFGGLAWS